MKKKMIYLVCVNVNVQYDKYAHTCVRLSVVQTLKTIKMLGTTTHSPR